MGAGPACRRFTRGKSTMHPSPSAPFTATTSVIVTTGGTGGKSIITPDAACTTAQWQKELQYQRCILYNLKKKKKGGGHRMFTPTHTSSTFTTHPSISLQSCSSQLALLGLTDLAQNILVGLLGVQHHAQLLCPIEPEDLKLHSGTPLLLGWVPCVATYLLQPFPCTAAFSVTCLTNMRKCFPKGEGKNGI